MVKKIGIKMPIPRYRNAEIRRQVAIIFAAQVSIRLGPIATAIPTVAVVAKPISKGRFLIKLSANNGVTCTPLRPKYAIAYRCAEPRVRIN